jgi:hypothetical protein
VKLPAFAPWWPRAFDQMLKFTGTGDDKEDDFCDMCSLIGQALEGTVKPSAEFTSNIIKLPKVGTFGWTIYAHRKEQQRKKAVGNLRGM